jgi:predicted tellurium resistance membrane protein TerC
MLYDVADDMVRGVVRAGFFALVLVVFEVDLSFSLDSVLAFSPFTDFFL